MAYGLIMTAVKEEAVAEYLNLLDTYLQEKSQGPRPYLQPEKIIDTSHYYASAGTGNPELDEPLYELFDGGKKLHESFWHPYRPPMIHSVLETEVVISRFLDAWSKHKETLDEEDLKYWLMDLESTLELLHFIQKGSYQLMTFMDRPFDKERADRVYFPIVYEDIKPFEI